MEIYKGPINLRNLNDTLIYQDGGFKTIKNKGYDEENNDEEYYFDSYQAWAKYTCNGNTILAEFDYYNDESEARSIIEESGEYCVTRLFNAMIDPYYSYLMNVLNTNSCITVLASQQSGTTADFIIYYNNEIIRPDFSKIPSCKYMEYKDKEFEQIVL